MYARLCSLLLGTLLLTHLTEAYAVPSHRYQQDYHDSYVDPIDPHASSYRQMFREKARQFYRQDLPAYAREQFETTGLPEKFAPVPDTFRSHFRMKPEHERTSKLRRLRAENLEMLLPRVREGVRRGRELYQSGNFRPAWNQQMDALWENPNVWVDRSVRAGKDYFFPKDKREAQGSTSGPGW